MDEWSWYRNEESQRLELHRGEPTDTPPMTASIWTLNAYKGKEIGGIDVCGAGRSVQISVSPKGRKMRIWVDGVEIEALHNDA